MGSDSRRYCFRLDSLSLADVYGVLPYYLRHKAEVEAYYSSPLNAAPMRNGAERFNDFLYELTIPFRFSTSTNNRYIASDSSSPRSRKYKLFSSTTFTRPRLRPASCFARSPLR